MTGSASVARDQVDRVVDILVEPHQRALIESTAPTTVLQGGAGSGKTWTLALLQHLECLRHPGIRYISATATYPVLQFSLGVHLEDLAAKMGLTDRLQWNRSDNWIRYPNGSRAWMRSAERPASLLAGDVAMVGADEVALWPRLSFDYAQGRIRQTGFPHAFRAGFTPKGCGHWTFREFGPEQTSVVVIRAKSSDNRANGADYIERMERTYGKGSALYRQEVLGEYVAWEGLIYSMFSRDRHVGDVPDPPRGQQWVWSRCVGGADWGWTNPGCLLVGCLDADDVLWIVDEVYERQRSIEWWADKAVELRKRHGAAQWFCDPSEPGNIAEFRKRRLAAERGNNRVIPGIMTVSSRLETDRLVIGSKCVNLIAEMEGMYCWATTSSGEIKGDTPDAHSPDHACDTIRYLAQGLTAGGLRAKRSA